MNSVPRRPPDSRPGPTSPPSPVDRTDLLRYESESLAYELLAARRGYERMRSLGAHAVDLTAARGRLHELRVNAAHLRIQLRGGC